MADILIRGMKMPKDCPMCKLAHFNIFDEFTGCDAVPGKRYVPHSDYQFWNSAERPEWCPILPLPEGHGRLIDADELMNRARGCLDELTILSLEFLVNGSSTIVPAEGGTDDGV